MSRVHIADSCMGCGCCAELCPHERIQMKNYHAEITGCKECPDCQVRTYDCPGDAIKITE